MSKIKIGDVFGDIRIIDKPLTINKQYVVKGLCKCGTEKYFQPYALTSGKTKRCHDCSITKINISEYLNFKVIGEEQNNKKRYIRVKCNSCNNEKLYEKSYFNTKPNIQCTYCMNDGLTNDNICITYLKKIKNNALKRGLEFDVDEKYLWNLFIKQNKKCALSGIDLVIIHSSIRLYAKKNTASLDRINSKKGYIKDNVQWVHKDINKLKSNFDEDYFKFLCKKITEHNLKVNNGH